MTRTERRSRPRVCSNDYEFICGRSRRAKKTCCWYEEETTEVTIPAGAGVFTLQNQWGTDWGVGGQMKYRAAVNG